MGEAFREVAITWKGKEYVFVPSASMLRRIKADGVNNLRLAHELLQGNGDPSELAVAVRHMLLQAGQRVPDDDCYIHLTGGDIAEITKLQEVYVGCVIPSIDLGKKPEAQSE
jgi:hypothetical protein